MDALLKNLMKDEELDYDDDVFDWLDRLPEVTVNKSEVTKKAVFDERAHQLKQIADEIARIYAMQKEEVERWQCMNKPLKKH